MMSKQIEALKLAQDLRVLADRFSEGWHEGIKIDASDILLLSNAAEALADHTDQPLEMVAEQPAQGCDYCNHPQYAGIKCKNCGREQPAQQQEHVIDCPRCGHCCPQPAQPSKPWVGLTQEDMYEIGEFKNTHGYVPTGFKRLATAIEAKLREKNA